MSRDIDDRSSDILNFRPTIEFVEPDQEDQEINPVVEPKDEAKEFNDKINKLLNLANAVDVLAQAVQARVDRKAADMKIKLDPKVDAAAIAALKRQYPDIPFTTDETDDGPEEGGFFITYDIYKQCRDKCRLKGIENGEKPLTDLTNLNPNGLPGGWGTQESKEGGLRPELSSKAQVIEPMDIAKFQNYLIRILVNFIWKKFIKPAVFGPIPPIPGIGKLSDLVPDELAKLPSSFKKQIGDVKKKGVEVL